jgi:hypothetical protein
MRNKVLLFITKKKKKRKINTASFLSYEESRFRKRHESSRRIVWRAVGGGTREGDWYENDQKTL